MARDESHTESPAGTMAVPAGAAWGSDVIAEALAATGVSFIALTPGSSFRGLHDSLVNHLGATAPEMLVCLHEEHSVAIAHGYAKVTGRPMAVALHANVGLMHAAMAIYNAYCDRVPMLMVGATGPVDAARRRPWIDWIHTSGDQGMIVRPYVKWDDQPMSVDASVASIAQGNRITQTHPQAPVYICLDVSVQEEAVTAPSDITQRVARTAPVPDAVPAAQDIARAIRLLQDARNPVVLLGRTGGGEDNWAARIRLAETLGARVVTDAKMPASFPTEHPLHAGVPAIFLDPANAELLRSADVVLALDWADLGGTLAAAEALGATVISATVDHHLHNGWAKNSFGPPPVDLALPCTADVAVAELLDALSDDPGDVVGPASPPGRDDGFEDAAAAAADAGPGAATVAQLQRALYEATRDTDPCLIRTPLAWDTRLWPLSGPLDALGMDGGGGIGSGPGMAVGAALALRHTGRLPVAVLGDGDLLMGGSALWTASKHDIPLLVVVANNASFYNDEVHQRTIALARGRDPENASIGIGLDGPAADLAGFARSLGFDASGPITSADDLRAALSDAVKKVRAGGRVLVDVQVSAGYAPHLTAALSKD